MSLTGSHDPPFGLRHAYALDPDPPAPLEPTTVRLRAERPVDAAVVRAVVERDGRREPLEVPMAYRGDGVWEAVLPGQARDATVRYRVEVRTADGVVFVSDAAPRYRRPATGLGVVQPPRSGFSYRVHTPRIPDWALDAVVYHVLVDRYAAVGRRLPAAEDIGFLDFAGGTLRGLVDRIDHIAELGADVLWISPIFPARMHVCYDVEDLFAVDPRLGTIDDARELCRQAHARGMRVLLDLEVSYLGAGHPAVASADADPEGPHARWFHRTDDGRPFGWFGHPAFRAVDHACPEAREHLLSAARFWLEVGFDGFRLDSAHAASFDFWTDFGAVCSAVSPEAFCVAEALLPTAECLKFAGRLDGFLDFELAMALRSLAGGLGSRPSEVAEILRARAALPPALAAVPFLDNHDMDRLAYAVGGDERRVRLGLTLLLTLPGPPVIYYGTEVGLSQPGPGDCAEVARRPMLWGPDQDRDRFHLLRELVGLRREQVSLRRGAVRPLVADDGDMCLAYARSHDDETTIVAVNASERASAMRVPSEVSEVRFGRAQLEAGPGGLRVVLAPLEAVVLG